MNNSSKGRTNIYSHDTEVQQVIPSLGLLVLRILRNQYIMMVPKTLASCEPDLGSLNRYFHMVSVIASLNLTSNPNHLRETTRELPVRER